MTEPDLSHVADILAAHQILSLATTSSAGAPWASHVFFSEEVSDVAIILYFATLKPSRKLTHIASNPRVSFAVGDQMPSRWLQGSGVAEKIEDAGELKRIHALIGAKAPAYSGFISAVETEVFRIEVGEIRVVDLTGGFPRVFWKRP